MNFKARMITHEVISGLGCGLFLAIQGIFFLEKGLELWQIGLLFGTLSVATVWVATAGIIVLVGILRQILQPQICS